MILDEIKDVLKYNPDTGLFFWLIFRKNARGVSKFPMMRPAGSLNKKKGGKTYLNLQYKSMTYTAGRLAWFFIYGYMPPEKMFVDHIDGDTLNNKFSNLRLLTPSENAKNVVLKTDEGLLFCRCYFKKPKESKKQFFEPKLPLTIANFSV